MYTERIIFHVLSIMYTTFFQLSTYGVMSQHIDHIMSSHGKQIMQAVTLILEADHSIEVKEQASLYLCRTFEHFAPVFVHENITSVGKHSFGL